MRAVLFNEYGGPDVLHVGEAAEPHAGAGQVRVAVGAVGVNPIDWKVRSGAMAQFMPVEFPSVPGEEAAGVVDEVGDGVDDVAVGDEVFGFAVGGGAAEYALLDHYADKPAGRIALRSGAHGCTCACASPAATLHAATARGS